MAGTYSLQIKGLDSMIADFKKAGVNYAPLLRQAMDKGTKRVQQVARDVIRANGTTFQGNLARSITVRESTERRGVIGVGERYGGAVEFGRRPGSMPPSAPLERWAQLKLGKPGLGFVIAQKIKRVGTKAQPFMEPAYRESAPYVLDQFKQVNDIIVRIMAGKQ